jgi:hypothetical protein
MLDGFLSHFSLSGGQVMSTRLKLCLAVAVPVLLVGGALLVYALLPRAVTRPENRGHARNALEALVRDSILNSSPDPKAVEFLVWGPHATNAEWRALWAEAGIAKGEELLECAVVRVRYRDVKRVPVSLIPEPPADKAERVTYDRLYLIARTQVMDFGEGKDDWREDMRRKLGVKVNR